MSRFIYLSCDRFNEKYGTRERMKAIRPIYDGKDDLDFREEIDVVDMAACLFSELTTASIR